MHKTIYLIRSETLVKDTLTSWKNSKFMGINFLKKLNFQDKETIVGDKIQKKSIPLKELRESRKFCKLWLISW